MRIARRGLIGGSCVQVKGACGGGAEARGGFQAFTLERMSGWRFGGKQPPFVTSKEQMALLQTNSEKRLHRSSGAAPCALRSRSVQLVQKSQSS